MANSFDCFSVLFGKDKVFINGKAFAFGQCSTDILNLNGGELSELDRRIGKLMPAVKNLFSEKTDSAAHSAQELLCAVWELIFSFPVYRDLDMDVWTANNLFPLLLSAPEKWLRCRTRPQRDTLCFRSSWRAWSISQRAFAPSGGRSPACWSSILSRCPAEAPTPMPRRLPGISAR